MCSVLMEAHSQKEYVPGRLCARQSTSQQHHGQMSKLPTTRDILSRIWASLTNKAPAPELDDLFGAKRSSTRGKAS